MESALGVILLVLVIGSFALAIVRPWICFSLVIAYPVIEQAMQSYYPFFNTYRSLFNFMIAGLVAFTVLVRFFREPKAWRGLTNRVQMMGYILLCISYLSLLWTPELDNGLEYTFRRLPYTLLYMVLAPLLLTSLDDFQRVRIPMIIIAAGSLLLFVLGPAAQFYGTRLVIHYGADQRGNAGIVGELGAIVLIFAALSTFKGLGKLALPLQLGAGVFGLGMGFFSGSRGQVIFGGLVSFLYYPIARKIKDTKGFMGLGLGLLILLGVIYGAIKLFITDENVERWTSDSFTGGFTGRWEIVTEAMGPWLSDPMAWIFGRGAGSFMSVNSAHVYPHNHPIEALTELGLIGFTVYALLILYALKSAIGLHRLFKDDPDKRSPMAVLFGLSTFCFLISLKQGSVHHLGLLYVWYFVMGRIFAYESEEHRLREEEETEELDSPDDGEEYDETADPDSGYSHA